MRLPQSLSLLQAELSQFPQLFLSKHKRGAKQGCPVADIAKGLEIHKNSASISPPMLSYWKKSPETQQHSFHVVLHLGERVEQPPSLMDWILSSLRTI